MDFKVSEYRTESGLTLFSALGDIWGNDFCSEGPAWAGVSFRSEKKQRGKESEQWSVRGEADTRSVIFAVFRRDATEGAHDLDSPRM